VTYPTASKSTHRLIGEGLLVLDAKATADYASIYRLKIDGQTFTLPHNDVSRECKSLFNHDVFRYRGLGKGAAEVWTLLQIAPATIDDLVKKTGRHKRTVKRTLSRMVSLVDTVTGELMPMVKNDGDEWFACDVDLNSISKIVGTFGVGKRQKEKHKQEQYVHRLQLELGRRQMKQNDKTDTNDYSWKH